MSLRHLIAVTLAAYLSVVCLAACSSSAQYCFSEEELVWLSKELIYRTDSPDHDKNMAIIVPRLIAAFNRSDTNRGSIIGILSESDSRLAIPFLREIADKDLNVRLTPEVIDEDGRAAEALAARWAIFTIIAPSTEPWMTKPILVPMFMEDGYPGFKQYQDHHDRIRDWYLKWRETGGPEENDASGD